MALTGSRSYGRIAVRCFAACVSVNYTKCISQPEGTTVPNYNHVELMGFMARDSELKMAPGERFGFCNGTIRVKDRFGNRDQELNFFNFSYAGDDADKYHAKLKKGNGLMLVGKLRLEKWESRHDGQQRSGVRIIAERIIVLSENGTENRHEHSGMRSDERELPMV